MFGNLPTLKELLDTPPLKSLVARANSTAIATRARTLLEDLTRTPVSEWKSSVAELAERFTRIILSEERSVLRPGVNASGDWRLPQFRGAFLPDAAISSLIAASRGSSVLGVEEADGRRSALTCLEPLLCELTGAEAAGVVSSYRGAWMLAASSFSLNGEIKVASDGGPQEFNNEMSEGIAGSGTATCRNVGTSEPRSADVVRDIGWGALAPLAECGLAHIPNFREAIDKGFSVVIGEGGGLVGGPGCGIVVGKQERIAKLLQHPGAKAFEPDRLTLSALEATLRLYREPAKLRHTVPVLQMLCASTDNLKLRASRISQQLAAIPGISAALPTAILDTSPTPPHLAPQATWRIEIETVESLQEKLMRRLFAGTPAITPVSGTRMITLDLRTVLPRQEQALIDAVAAAVSPASHTPAPLTAEEITATAHA